MGTSVAKDNAKFLDVTTNFEVAARSGQMGSLVYAGNLWPTGVINTNAVGATAAARQMRREIDFAFGEARAMVIAGYVKATAALKGDEAACLLMKKWFGTRQTAPGSNDWWLGAQRILGNLQTQLMKSINLFYRGDDSLIGQPNDYPGIGGNLSADDVAGYAETYGSASDGNIGLCKLFFRRESGGVFKTAQKGRDSVGGCLAHELSHNYCGTLDHDAVDGGSCYGERKCRELGRKRRRRAWYNADNIEYFCEDAYYGILAGKAAIATGAVSSVTNVRNAHKQVADAMKPRPERQVAPGGPKPASQVTGSVALLRAHLQASAVSQNPTLSVVDEAPGRQKVSQLLSMFEHQ